MSAYIELNKLDLVVLGQVQHDFTVGGESGLDLATACMMSTFRRTLAVEKEMDAVMSAIKLRSDRCHHFGEAMEYVNGALGWIADMSDEKKIGDEANNLLNQAKSIIRTYGLESDAIKLSEIPDHPTVNVLRKLSENLKYELDKEDNALKRDASMLQTMVSRRDSAVNMQGKIQKKVTKTESTTIRNIGK